MSSRVLRVPRDTGTVLVVVMLVMITLLGLGLTGLFLTNSAVRMSTNINFRNQALVVAEAGLERAQQVLNDPSRVPNIPALLAGSPPPPGHVPPPPPPGGGPPRARRDGHPPPAQRSPPWPT